MPAADNIGDQSSQASEASSRRSVADLIEAMNKKVTAYGEGVVPISRDLSEGTQFFPGACGVWMEDDEISTPSEILLPVDGVVVFGNNYYGTDARPEEDGRQTIAMLQSDPTWRGLLKLLDDPELAIDRRKWFFTNALMGLRVGSAVGGVRASKTYFAECEELIRLQITWMQPRLVIVMGPNTIKRFRAVSPELAAAWGSNDSLWGIAGREQSIVNATFGNHRCTVVIIPHACAWSWGPKDNPQIAATERYEKIKAALARVAAAR